MTVKAYIGTKMTGRMCKDLYWDAQRVQLIFRSYGVEPLNPIIEENIAPSPKILEERSELEMRELWRRDKAMIREAHVFVDSTAHLKSIGVEREAGKARYSQWKPLIRIYPYDYKVPYIAKAEDDLCVFSIKEAAIMIDRYWGTWWKRAVWRLKLYNQKLPRWFADQIGFFL